MTYEKKPPKAIQRFLMLVGKDISVCLTNGKTINGVLDSFLLKLSLAYIVVETKESMELINFANIISLRTFKEQQTETYAKS